jgi:hypothetical protein
VSNSPLGPLDAIAGTLVVAAEATARAARRNYRARRRSPRGNVLRPGPETPLWNELAREVAAQLTRYGEKAKLARLLGIPRQRLHVLLVAKNACPDAERALQLLVWLQARRRGIDPA